MGSIELRPKDNLNQQPGELGSVTVLRVMPREVTAAMMEILVDSYPGSGNEEARQAYLAEATYAAVSREQHQL